MKQGLCILVLSGLPTAGVLFAQAAAIPPGQGTALQATANVISGDLISQSGKKLEKRVAQMAKRYKLTAEQQRQLKSILWKEQQDTETLNADTFMSSGSKRNELADLHEASLQKIGSILDTKQKRKFASDVKTRAWMEDRLPEPNPGPPLNF